MPEVDLFGALSALGGRGWWRASGSMLGSVSSIYGWTFARARGWRVRCAARRLEGA